MVELLVVRCAGLDVAKDEVVACVRVPDGGAIVSRDNPTLFELLCTFAVIDALRACGWHPGPSTSSAASCT
jgi:hypothetical protein